MRTLFVVFERLISVNGTQARDTFYACLEMESNKKPTEIASVGLLYPAECKKSRDQFVKQCRPTWVKHFDRQHASKKRLQRLLDDSESRRAPKRRGFDLDRWTFLQATRCISLHDHDTSFHGRGSERIGQPLRMMKTSIEQLMAIYASNGYLHFQFQRNA